MGSGSSRKRQVNRHVQVPSSAKTLRRSPSPEPSEDSSKRPYSSPLLIKDQIRFPQSNSSLSHYQRIWESNGKVFLFNSFVSFSFFFQLKLTSTFEQLIRTAPKAVEHEQKEIRKSENITKQSSSYQTASVQSTVKSEVQSIHKLTTPDKLDILILNLKQTQTDFDDAVKRRIGQITNETESILAQIVEETQTSQQELLNEAKKQQTIEDDKYRALLEEFIQKLDEKRAKQLASFQEDLQQQRLQIFNQSEIKIRALNDQANSIKSNIMTQEEKKAAEKISAIVDEINTISTESAFQNVGAQITTNINVDVIQTVGSSTQVQQEYTTTKQQHVKRTIYLENESQFKQSSTTDQTNFQGKSIHKLARENPSNPKTKS